MNKKHLFPFITFFLLTIFCGHGFCQSVNVPIDHWLYPFLERLETKGLFRSVDLRSKPLSRKETADLLILIEKEYEKNPGALSRTEYAIFEQLKGEFCDDFTDEAIPFKQYYRERHLLTWQEQGNKAFIDAFLGERVNMRRGDSYDKIERISHTTLGGIVRLSLSNNIYLYLDARNTLIRGSDITDENFDPSQGAPVVTSGSNVYSDQAEAYTTFKKSCLQFELGRSAVHWGPGWRGGLALSRNAPIFDMIKLKLLFERFKFTSIHGFLRSPAGSRYLAAHRLEIKLHPNVYIGASETVVYSGRDVEFMYLNPIMPYHVAEHHLGDKDNNMMSLDFVAFPFRNTKLYGEFFIDDMTTTENLFTYFGNKFGFLLGTYWIEPFGLHDCGLRLEYTRIEPYVYTHYDSLDQYTNYDQIMGHWLGPNSDLWAAGFEYRLGRDIHTELLYQRIRHGQGDINTYWKKEYGERKEFLGGPVETSHSLGFKITNQVRRDIFLTIHYALIHTDNSFQQNGKSAMDHSASFQLMINY